MGKIYIHFDYVLKSLLNILIVFLLVFVVPFLNLSLSPIVLTIGCFLLFFFNSGEGFDRFDLVILTIILVLLFTTMFSIEIHRSWVWSVEIAGYFVILLVSREIIRHWLPLKILVIGLLIAGILYQAFLTIMVFNWFFGWHILFPEFNLPPISYRLENGNAKAAYLIPIFILQTSIMFNIKSRIVHLFSFLGIIWTLILIYFCSSRGGVIGLIAGIFCILILERDKIINLIKPILVKRSKKLWLLITMVFFILSILSIIGFIIFTNYEAHPSHSSFGLDSRIQFWKPAWKAFTNSIFMGNGIFTTVNYYIASRSIPPNGLYTHSHNMILDILEGTGILGLLSAVYLVFLLMKNLLYSRKNFLEKSVHISNISVTNLVFAFNTATISTLFYFLIHGLFDNMVWQPRVALTISIILGASLAFTNDRVKLKLPVDRIIAVLVLVSSWSLFYIQSPYSIAVKGWENLTWQQTASRLDESVNRLPISPLFQREAGYAWAELAAQGKDLALDQAIQHFEAAVEYDPNFAMNWLNLGALRRERGDLQGARLAMETATNKAQLWGLVWLNLGEVCELSGDGACAYQAYLKALTLEPNWASDPYWQQNQFRRDTLMVAYAPQSIGGDLALMEMDAALHQGYARPLIELAKVKLAAGELDDAERLIKLAPMLYTRNESEIVEIHWLKANLAAARYEFTLASELGVEAREEFTENRMNDAIIAGVSQYGPWIYLLPTLGIDIVPQVTWMQYPGDWQDRMEKLAIWQELSTTP